MKVLYLDIETSPNLAHVWGIRDQTISLNQLMESSYTLCWAAKWQGDSRVHFDSVYQSKPKAMVKRVHALLDEADMVIHYHGSSFDIPTLNKEFLLHGMPPPSPVCELDLLRVVRRKFRFPSNKLDYVAQRLGLGKKYEHEGHALWVKCMNNDPRSWSTMETYNKRDVLLLEALHHRLLPWMKGMNYSTFTESMVCPSCGSKRYQRRGYAFTQAGKYVRYQCLSCHGWFRGKVNSIATGEKAVHL